MRYIELSGSMRDIGRGHGEAFRDDIRHYYEFYCTRHGKTPETLHPSIREYVEAHLPAVTEELRGIAAGADMRYEDILVYNHFNVVTGCTPVFFRSTELGPLVGQNLDCDPEEREALLVRQVKPDTGHGFLGVSFVGTVWAGNWVSSAGLCQAAVSAHHVGYRKTDGTSGGIIGSAVARTAGTCTEVLHILQKHRWIGKVGVQLYGHRDGEAIIVEGTADEKFAAHVDADFAFTTGLFTSGRVTAQNEPDYLMYKIERTKTIDALAAAGQIEFSLDGMKALLGYHRDGPGSVCRHDPRHGSCTQSARIMAPARGELLVSDGPGCCNPFQTYRLGSE